MSKMKNLYKLNMNNIHTLNIAHLNPTMKAIVKGMYKLEKNNENERGMCGDEILKYCVKNSLWKTTQEESKYNTTWAYYVKRLCEECNVIKVGTIESSLEEYLE